MIPMSELRADPSVDQLLRNLTISNKKWTDIVAEILELGRCGAAEAETLILSESQNLLQAVKSNSVDNSNLIGKVEQIKLLNHYLSQNKHQYDHKKTVLMNWFLEKLLIQKDVPFKDYSQSKFIADLLDDSYVPQLMKVDEAEVEKLVNSSLFDNSLSSNLITLYTLLFIHSEGMVLSNPLNSLISKLSRCYLLSKEELVDALQVVSMMEMKKIFACGPRMTVISGFSSDCTKFDIRGDVVACGMGLSYHSENRLSYYEICLQGKHSSVNGIRIGWADKCISTTKDSLGSEPTSWIIDLSTGKFFHNDSEATTVATTWIDKKESAQEADVSESLDHDMFGDLFGQEDDSSTYGNDDSIVGIVSTTELLENNSPVVNWNKVHTIGCLLDNHTGNICFYADGVFSGIRSCIDLTTVTLDRLAPIISSNTLTTCDVNLGQKPFKYFNGAIHDYQKQEAIDHAECSTFDNIQQSSFISFPIADDSHKLSIPFVSLKNVVRDSCKSLTFEASVRFSCKDLSLNSNATQTGREFVLFACSQSELVSVNSLSQGCVIGVDVEGRLFFELNESNRIKTEPHTITFGEWSHVSISYTFHRSSGTADIVFYLNGQIVLQSELSGSRSFKLSKLFPKYIWMGILKSAVNSSSGSGKITSTLFDRLEMCNVRLWSSSRSNDRVLALMQRDKLIGVENELLCFLPCNEGIGKEIYDVSKGKSVDKDLKVNHDFEWEKIENNSENFIQAIFDSTSSLPTLSNKAYQDRYACFNAVVSNESNQSVARWICCILAQLTVFLSKIGDLSNVICSGFFEQSPFRSWITPTTLNLELLVSIIKFLEYFDSGLCNKDVWIPHAIDNFVEILGLNVYFLQHSTQSLVIDRSMKVGVDIRSNILKVFLKSIKLANRPSVASDMLAKNILFFFEKTESIRKLLEVLLVAELPDCDRKIGILDDNLLPDLPSLSLSQEASNASFYDLDPISCMATMPSSSRMVLLNSLCTELARLIYWKDLKESNGFRTLLSRDSMVSTLAQNKPSSVKCRMRCGCLVKRGPDWRYGDEDGGEGSVGVVLDISNWLNEPGRGITVVWSNSNIEKYRWNASKPDSHEKCFDIEVVELDETDRNADLEILRSSLPTKIAIKFHPQDVDDALLNKKASSLSKISILQYLLETAPTSWIDSKDMLKQRDVALLHSTLNEIEVCQLYKEFHDAFGKEPTSLDEYFEGHLPCHFGSLVSLLFMLIANSTCVSGAKELVKSLQYVILGSYELSTCANFEDNSKVSLIYQKDNFTKEFGDIQGKYYTWNWPQCSWILTREVQPKSESITPTTPKEPMIVHAKIIARFSFENCHCPDSIQIRARSRSCDITMMGNKEWTTIVADMPLKPNTGNYIWYIKIRNMDKRSRFIFGISKQHHTPDDFIGEDENSWGLTQNLEYFHDGKKVSMADEDHRLMNGSILEVSFDTSNGNLRFLELTQDQVYQMNMSLLDLEKETKGLHGKTVFPAFSFFAPGDSISLVTDPDEIKMLRGKFTKNGSILMAGRSSFGSLSSVPQKIYPGSPPKEVVNNVFALVQSLNHILHNQSSGYSLDQDIWLITMHSLGMLCRWTAPPLVLVDELKTELLKLLERTSHMIEDYVQSSSKKFQDETQNSNHSSNTLEIMNQLMVVITSSLGKLFSYLVRSDRFVCSNELMTKLDVIPSVEDSFEDIKRKINDFIASDLMIFGFRKTPSNVEDIVFMLKSNQTNKYTEKMSKVVEALHFRALQRQPSKAISEAIYNDTVHHAVFIAFIYHVGLLPNLLRILDTSDEDFNISSLPTAFVTCWDAAQQVITSAIDINDDRVAAGTVITNLLDRVTFAVKLQPMVAEVPLNALEDSDIHSSQRSRVVQMENSIQTLKSSLLLNVDIKVVENVCQSYQEALKRRSEGFKLIKAMTDILGSPNFQDCKTIFFDRFSMTLKGLYSNWVRSDFSQAIAELKRKEKSWYYEDGLKGVGIDMKKELKGSFGLMLGTLVSELNSSELTSGHYQLSLLSALAFRLESGDHESLVRVSFFFSVQELLENLLRSLALNGHFSTACAVSDPTNANFGNNGQLLIIGMKLFIFIGMQIASFGQDEGSLVRSVTREFSSGPEFHKVKSGPSTLNSAVFEILYDFLTSLRSTSPIKESAALVNDCVGLLFCVSKHPECQKILSKSKWIQLVVSIIDSHNDDFTAQKLLLTLSDILITVKPSNLESSGISDSSMEGVITSSPAENLAKKLLTFLGSKLVGLKAKFNRKGMGSCNFGVLNECISLVRKLYSTADWTPILDKTMNETLNDPSLKLPVMGVLLVLGGSFFTLYPSCPVVVKLSGGMGIGVIKSFSESSDMVDISCCKLLSVETGSESSGFHYALPAVASVPSHFVHPLSWEDRLVSVDQEKIFSSVLQLTSELWERYSYTPSNNGNVQDSKEELTKSIVEEKLLHVLLLKCIVSCLANKFVGKACLQSILNWKFSCDFIRKVAEESKKAANVGGLIETSIHEQYLVSLISFFNGDHQNGSSSVKEAESKKSEDKDREEDESSSMVETLVNMGFPRKLCILALQICGGDPAEALNYILSNGSALVEMLRKAEARESGSSSGLSNGDNKDQKGKAYHYDKSQRIFHPYYTSPSVEAERIGAILPGEQITVLEEKEIDGQVWFRVPLSDFNNPNLQNNYGEEIKSIYVWVPKLNDLMEEVIFSGPNERKKDAVLQLEDPPIAPLYIQRSYRVIGTNGALVRVLPSISSDEITTLSAGTVVIAVEESINQEGTIRLRITDPVVGWISKIPGLLERIPNVHEFNSPSSVTSSSSSQLRPEISLMLQLEDNFECITGTDVFAKEDRFFGNLQGGEHLFLANPSRFHQVFSNKKQRICGSKSFGHLFSLSLSSDKLRNNFESTVHNLRSLLCRNLLVICGLKYALYQRTLVAENALVNNSLWMQLFASRITPTLFLRWIRFVSFREDPYSNSGFEILNCSLLERLGCDEQTMVLEEQLNYIVTPLLEAAAPEFRIEFNALLVDAIAKNLRDACDTKFQDLSWVDATYEEDMDKDIVNQPNLHFSLWGTKLLMNGDETLRCVLQALQIWILSLRGTSMTLKYFSFKMSSIILKYLREQHSSHCGEALHVLRSIIPVDRLMSCASRRIWMEMEDSPSYSRFLQAFVNFLLEIHLLSASIPANEGNLPHTPASDDAPNSRLAKGISFNKASSHVKFLPQKDLPGSWTLEVWLYRHKGVENQHIPYFAKKSSLNANRNAGGSSTEKKSSLSSLLQLLLGKDMESNNSSSSLGSSSSNTADEGYCWCIDPSYLISSSKVHIKLQKGGRIFAKELSDAAQETEWVHDEAFCIAMGQHGSEDKVFDCVVPCNQWVHVAFVADTQHNLTSVYLDGKFIDSQQFTMQFPIAILGSIKTGQSFNGIIQDMKLWSYARSQQEISRNMKKMLPIPTTELLVHLSCGGTSGELVYDRKTYIVACKHIDCALENVDDVYPMDDEVSGTLMTTILFDSSSRNVYELTGYLAIPSFGQKAPLANGIREIVVIYFSVVNQTDSESASIVGFVNWSERNVKTLLNGNLVNREGKIQLDFNSKGADVLFGSPEKLSWLQSLSYSGPFNDGVLSGACLFTVKIETIPLFEPGSLRIDLGKLPAEVIPSETGKKCKITARDGTSFGQYLVFFHVYPNKQEIDSDGSVISTAITSSVGWNGITRDKGSIWVDFLVNHNCGEIAFGWSTADALVHPDASVDANEGTWTYSTAGSSSHGGDLYLSDVAEDGDIVSMHLNSDTGLVRFYKNNTVVVEFNDLLKDECMVTGNGSVNCGVRPFVNLICEGDSVTLLGSKEGAVEITFSEEDEHQRRKLYGFISKGCIEGQGILQTIEDNMSGWFGMWENDHQCGHHIHIEDLQATEPHILAINLYSWDDAVKTLYVEEVPVNEEILLGLVNKFKAYREQELKRGNLLFGGFSDSGNATSSSENIDGETIKLSFTLVQCEPPRTQTVVTSPTSPLTKAFEEYASLHDCPAYSFLFYVDNDSTPLDSSKTALEYGLTPNSLIKTKARAYAIPDKSAEDPVDQYFAESTAKYVVQIVYESGATVRDGVEIEECAALRTLHFTETVEAFEKGYTSEGIGRFRIPDGWISEKLRGRIETPVTRLLRERFGPDQQTEFLKFKVTRDIGIKFRAKASLQSLDLGQIPTDTIISVSERRQIYSQEEKSWINRLYVVSPDQYRGWISEKSHLVTEIKDELSANGASSTISKNPKNDPAFAMELKRRNKIRLLRKTKKSQELSQKKHYKSMTVIGEVQASSETLFLLKKGKYSENSVKFSPDFTSIKCSESGGRSLVLGSRGFSHGIHYWEVEVKAANWGSVFIGVAPEEASGWNGFGFINYRATQAFGNESIYGTYFGVNDKIGVLLDMDRGTISFFKDGEDFNYGKVTVVNMGVAYHNLRKTTARYSSSQMLFPCFGMKSGDELSIKHSHWISTPGFDSQQMLSRLLTSLSIIHEWHQSLSEHRPLKFANNLGYITGLPEENLHNGCNDDESTIHQLYEEYVKKCNPQELYTESRPGLPITLSISNEDFYVAVGKEFADQYGLSIGAEVTTVYGKAILIGISQCKSRIWYSCEQNGKKAWYWLVPEFKELFASGKLTPLGTNSLAFTPNSLSSTTEVQENKGSSPMMSKEEFLHMLQESVWDEREEHRLVEAINQLAAHVDKDPSQLNIEVVADYLLKKGICQTQEKKKYIVRYVALCLLNRAVALSLPLIDLSIAESRKTLTRTILDKFDKNTNTLALPSSTRDTIFGLKRSIFTATKMMFWQLTIQETTSPTAAPADEYERPEEIREISINRIQARNAFKKKDTMSFQERLKLSVFGQLMDHISAWDDRSLRRSYIHMQDAGQCRGFFVKFVGEGVDDQGGPYRAVFQTAMGEEITDLLQLIIPCPNAIGEVGENRDKYVFNSSIDLTIHSNLFVHLGRMVGIGARHKILLPLSLAPLLWKALAGEPLSPVDLQSVDINFANSIKWITDSSDFDDEYKQELLIQALVDSAKLCGAHHKVHHQIVTSLVHKAVQGCASSDLMEEFDLNCENIIQLVQYFRLMHYNEILQYFFKGLAGVVPVELMSMFTATELETVFCGESELDLDVLKKVTVYESVNPTDSHIQYFWEALEKLDKVERYQFVNFCSGRSRLPTSASEFFMPFKLTAPHSSSDNEPDKYLPIARTCFFSLSIPKYTSSEICLAKLRYAINNTELMDADFIDRRGTSAWDNVN